MALPSMRALQASIPLFANTRADVFGFLPSILVSHTAKGKAMNVNEKVRWRERLLSKLRIAEDCLQRALDQLEARDYANAALEYVNRQVDLAHDAVIDAQGAASIVLADVPEK